MAERQKKSKSKPQDPPSVGTLLKAATILFVGAVAYTAVTLVSETFDEAFGDALRDIKGS